jgi:hypothetical protein
MNKISISCVCQISPETIAYCYDTEIPTFLSILSVIITKSGASKFHVTISKPKFCGSIDC